MRANTGTVVILALWSVSCVAKDAAEFATGSTAAASGGPETAASSSGHNASQDPPTETAAESSSPTTSEGAATTATTSGGGESTSGGDDELCDIVSQDCADGLKCVPFSSHGANLDSAHCIPAPRTPSAPGQACKIDSGLFFDQVDDCEAGSFCFYVNDDLTGVCVEFCDPVQGCADPGAGCKIFIDGGWLNLCVASCDPLQPQSQCPDGGICARDLLRTSMPVKPIRPRNASRFLEWTTSSGDTSEPVCCHSEAAPAVRSTCQGSYSGRASQTPERSPSTTT